MKQLREIQAERRWLEQEQLEELRQMAVERPEEIENIQPERFGFVCLTRDWDLFWKRSQLLKDPSNGPTLRKTLTRAA